MQNKSRNLLQTDAQRKQRKQKGQKYQQCKNPSSDMQFRHCDTFPLL